MSCTRKYSRTAFLSHSLTIQPPLPSGSATRRSPASMRSITRSTTGRVEPSISSGVSVVRRSQELSTLHFSSSDSGGAGGAFFFATFFVDLSLPDFDVFIVSLLHRCATAARRPGRRGCPGTLRDRNEVVWGKQVYISLSRGGHLLHKK